MRPDGSFDTDRTDKSQHVCSRARLATPRRCGRNALAGRTGAHLADLQQNWSGYHDRKKAERLSEAQALWHAMRAAGVGEEAPALRRTFRSGEPG